jgi:hypothetical protein
MSIEDIIKTNEVRKLDQQTVDNLEKAIDENEVFHVLINMKNNKSPGSDGFTVEFLIFFWKDLKAYIVQSINTIFVQKELPVSQRLGIISCLPKGDKPRHFIKKKLAPNNSFECLV